MPGPDRPDHPLHAAGDDAREPITLAQFLKKCGAAPTGGQAKHLARAGVRVNGQDENRPGRKLVPGDVVEVAGRRVVVEADGD